MTDSFEDRRKNPRFKQNVGLVLISGRRVFRSSSADISLGGLLLAVPPPRDYEHEDLMLVLLSPDATKNITTRVRFVDEDEQMRICFVDLADCHKEELQKWFDAAAAASIKKQVA